MKDRFPAEPVPAIGYVRVSMMKEEAISPDIQRAAISAYAGREGRRVVDWISDLDRTGRNFKRKVAGVIDRIETGEVQEILVYRFDRWGRNATESLANVIRVEKAGGSVISVSEPFDAETAVGKYTRTNAFALAEMQSDIIGENWRAALASRVDRKLPGTGAPRFGYVRRGRVRKEDDPKRYRSNPDDGTERYEIDPVTGPILAEAYRRYIAGSGQSATLRWINSTGARTVRGNMFGWRALFLVLDSGFGAGLLRVHDPDCRCRKKLGHGCMKAVYLPGAQPPVITMAEWEAYLARRMEMRAFGPRLHDVAYPLSGLVRCGTCRYRMSISHAGRRAGFAYRCPRNGQHQGCPGVWVQRSVLEKLVRAEVAQWAEDIDAAAEAERGRQASRERVRADIAGLQREIARLERALEKSVRDQAADEVTPSSVWENARKGLAADLAARTAALEAARRADARTVTDFSPVVRGIMQDWDRLPPARLREILRTLIREVRVTRTGVRTPPDIRVIPAWEPETDSETDKEEV